MGNTSTGGSFCPLCGMSIPPGQFHICSKVAPEPPVLSDEELEQVEKAYLNEDFSVNSIRLNRGNTEALRRRIAQAQRDADVRFYIEGKE